MRRRTRSRSRNGAEVDEIFGPSRKHIHEHQDWIAVARHDDRISGDGPLVDLDLGIATFTPPTDPDGE